MTHKARSILLPTGAGAPSAWVEVTDGERIALRIETLDGTIRLSGSGADETVELPVATQLRVTLEPVRDDQWLRVSLQDGGDGAALAQRVLAPSGMVFDCRLGGAARDLETPPTPGASDPGRASAAGPAHGPTALILVSGHTEAQAVAALCRLHGVEPGWVLIGRPFRSFSNDPQLATALDDIERALRAAPPSLLLLLDARAAGVAAAVQAAQLLPALLRTNGSALALDQGVLGSVVAFRDTDAPWLLRSAAGPVAHPARLVSGSQTIAWFRAANAPRDEGRRIPGLALAAVEELAGLVRPGEAGAEGNGATIAELGPLLAPALSAGEPPRPLARLHHAIPDARGGGAAWAQGVLRLSDAAWFSGAACGDRFARLLVSRAVLENLVLATGAGGLGLLDAALRCSALDSAGGRVEVLHLDHDDPSESLVLLALGNGTDPGLAPGLPQPWPGLAQLLQAHQALMACLALGGHVQGSAHASLDLERVELVLPLFERHPEVMPHLLDTLLSGLVDVGCRDAVLRAVLPHLPRLSPDGVRLVVDTLLRHHAAGPSAPTLARFLVEAAGADGTEERVVSHQLLRLGDQALGEADPDAAWPVPPKPRLVPAAARVEWLRRFRSALAQDGVDAALDLAADAPHDLDPIARRDVAVVERWLGPARSPEAWLNPQGEAETQIAQGMEAARSGWSDAERTALTQALLAADEDYATLRRADRAYEVLHDHVSQPSTGEPVVLLIARNEAERLPLFLSHYRALGVKRFLLVDNGSSDSTVEQMAQAGARVLRTRERYTESRWGVAWMNDMLERELVGAWVLAVDADELLVYPGSETVPLAHLAAWLEARGWEGLAAPMVETYPLGPIEAERFDEHARSTWRFFEAGPYPTYPVLNSPPLALTGGVRGRVFRFGAGALRGGFAIHKVPLVHNRPGFRFLTSMHSATPLRVPAFSGVLEHLKFLPSFARQARRERARGEHWANANEYRGFAEVMERVGAFSFPGPRSRERKLATDLVASVQPTPWPSDWPGTARATPSQPALAQPAA